MSERDKTENSPLGILLALLEKEKLDISNFSLAQVADDYLKFLTSFEDHQEILENISEFLWVVSRLALLKSKILVSTFNFDEIEEEEETNDLRDRLMEYKRFKEISKLTEAKLLDSEELIARKNQLNLTKDFSIDFKIKDLEKAFEGVILKFKAENSVIYPKVEMGEVIKIEERINQIKELLKKTKSFEFSKTFFKECNRSEVVVSFLSILELVKQGSVQAKQQNCFHEIMIISREES